MDFDYYAEDLGITSGVIQQAKHDCSPLSESLKEVLKKYLKNITKSIKLLNTTI